jgi:methylated-DNA-[protein]-cysteine S-methyltransferase
VRYAFEELPPAPADARPTPLAEALRQLDEYFAGARTVFDLPLDPAAGTDFQRAVWRAVARIPYGTTISYGELARRIGRPGHVRAAGARTRATRCRSWWPATA